jgi:hypothetical protein
LPALRDEIDLGVNEIAGLADLAGEEQEPRRHLTLALALTRSPPPRHPNPNPNQDPRHHLTLTLTLITRIPATT